MRSGRVILPFLPGNFKLRTFWLQLFFPAWKLIWYKSCIYNKLSGSASCSIWDYLPEMPEIHESGDLCVIQLDIFLSSSPTSSKHTSLFFSGSSFTFFSSPFVPSGELFVIHSGETPGVRQIKLPYTCFQTLDCYVYCALAWVISFLHETCIGWLWLRTSKILGELLYCSEGVKTTRLQTIYRGNYFLVTSVQWIQMLASGFLGGAT